jgi:ATP-dependent Clp protease ATP-binding subunit ClpA
MYESVTETFRAAVGASTMICSAEGKTALEANHFALAFLPRPNTNSSRLAALADKKLPGFQALCTELAPSVQGRAARLPQTDQAKALIVRAIDIARELGHRHVGTEHALIAAFELSPEVTRTISARLGQSTQDIARTLRNIAASSSEIAREA